MDLIISNFLSNWSLERFTPLEMEPATPLQINGALFLTGKDLQ